MKLLEYLFVGLLYLPFLIFPFALIVWSAFLARNRGESDQLSVNAPDRENRQD